MAVKTFVELLPEKNPDSEPTAVVQNEMARIDVIINRILKRLGPIIRDFARTPVEQFIDQSLRVCAPNFQRQSIRI